MRACEYGVELFFCVSGYVMVQALSRAAGPWSFLRDRAVRIVPLLWVVVPVSLVSGMLSGRREVWSLPAEEIAAVGLANMLALQGLFPIWMFNPMTWSLSYEMLFYALCASWLGLGWRGRGMGKVAIALAGGAILLFYPRGSPFVLGILVGLHHGEAPVELARRPGVMIAVFLLLWATVQAITADGVLLIRTTMFDWSGDLRLPLAAAALCALLFGFRGLAGGEGLLGRFLSGRAMQFLRTISYSFYLWQNVAIGSSRRILRVLIADDLGNPLVLAVHPVLA